MKAVVSRIVAACLALACLCAGASARQSPTGGAGRDPRRSKDWGTLLAYVGRDLWNEEAAPPDSVVAAAKRVVPDWKEPDASGGRDFKPRLVERVKTPAGARVLLLMSPSLALIHTDSRSRLYIFDEAGALRGTAEFSTGWRMGLDGAKLTRRAGLRPPLLVMKGSGFSDFALAPSLTAYYAVLGDRVALVRLEGEDGRSLRNGYGCRLPAFGPPPPRRSAGEWARSLASGDSAETLEALAWLGGFHESAKWLKEEQRMKRHWKERDPTLSDGSATAKLDVCPEALDDATAYAEARARADVRARVEELTKSEDEWVKQAAEWALELLKPCKWCEWDA